MKYDINEVKEKIKNVRINIGYSQKELAEKIGMDRSNYSKKENGPNQFTLREITKIIEVMKPHLNFLKGICYIPNDEKIKISNLKPYIDLINAAYETGDIDILRNAIIKTMDVL